MKGEKQMQTIKEAATHKANATPKNNNDIIADDYSEVKRGRPISKMEGLRFGMLTVLEFTGRTVNTSNGNSIWLCQCDCGNYTQIARNNLHNGAGATKSCGCLLDARRGGKGKGDIENGI